MQFLFYGRAGKSIEQIRDTLEVLSNKSSIFKTKKTPTFFRHTNQILRKSNIIKHISYLRVIL